MGVIDEELVEAPVRARPPVPSAINDEEADAYGEGRTAADAEGEAAALRKRWGVEFESGKNC